MNAEHEASKRERIVLPTEGGRGLPAGVNLDHDAAVQDLLDEGAKPKRTVLPTFRGDGVQPGIDLSNNAALLDLMDEDDDRGWH